MSAGSLTVLWPVVEVSDHSGTLSSPAVAARRQPANVQLDRSEMSPIQVRTAARITMEADRWVAPVIESIQESRAAGPVSESLYREAIIPLWSDGGAALQAISRSESLRGGTFGPFLASACAELRALVGDEFPEVRSLTELRGVLLFWIWDAATRPSKAFDSRPGYRSALLRTWATVSGEGVTREIEVELTGALERWTALAEAV